MFSRVLACVAVWGCSGALFGAAAATLVEDLSTNSQVVASSPYATGGDLILKLGDNEFVHVFAKAAGVERFVPNANLSARVLLVGGGGGAGYSYKPNTWQFAMAGGGGGGGAREYSNLALAKSTPYVVTVGAGGNGSSSRLARGSDGEASSIVGGDIEYKVLGGGGGGSASSDVSLANGSSLGTGGGASGWAARDAEPSVFGTPGNGSDYGKAGGEPSVNGKNLCGGGGGGAGEAGHQGGHTKNIQVGGNGLLSDILGSDCYFGGGGAGGSHSVNGGGSFLNRGGLGGGGDSYANSYATCYANNGLAGYGGGGAAGWACGGSDSLAGRNGGCGAVIIRYTYTPTGDSPILSNVKVHSADGGHRAVVSGFVCAFGSAESATVTVKIWPTSDPAAVQTRTVNVPCTQTDAFIQAVSGLIPGASYNYEVYIDAADKVEGTIILENNNPGISTTAASAQPVNGSSFEKCLVMPTGTNDVFFAGGYADVLLVGGGGAGGYGGEDSGGSGGGGGGGVIHIGRKYFSAGTYRVVVGSGGESVTKDSPAGWGSLSSLSLLSATDDSVVFPSIIAYGGGRGRGYWVKDVEDAICASTGGAAPASYFESPSTKIMDGQGHPGGSSKDKAAGGGGGAGGPGVSGATKKAGDGGPGKASSITGEIAYYGAGGGGATGSSSTAQRPGAGGSGVGGTGWDYLNSKVAPGTGMAGTGSGGGGGGKGYLNSGAGGDGTIIFRYFDGTAASGRTLPVITWFPEQYLADLSTLSFAVAVPFAGIGSDGVELSVRYWTNRDDCQDPTKATNITLDPNFMIPETKTFTIANLSPARTYFVQVLATNSNGADSSSIYEMRTRQGLGSTLTRSQSQAYNTFVYSVESLATGVSTLKLMASQDGGETWRQLGDSWTPQIGNPLEVGRNFLEAGFSFGVSTMCKLVLENSDSEKGVPASTCETDVVTFTLLDEATYTWSDNVSDGRWDDPASWTCSIPGFMYGESLGYPVAGSIVKFKDGQTNVVRMVKNEQCAELHYNINNAQIAYVGDNVILSANKHTADQTKNTKNSSFIFDGVTLDNAGGEFRPNAGCALILRNGAKMDFKLTADAGTFTLDIGYGCTVLGSNFSMSGTGNTFVVDDGLAVSANDLPIGENSSITIKGDRPAIQARTKITANNCYIDFYLPKNPYNEETIESSDLWQPRAPLRKNYVNDHSTHSLAGSTININRHSPFRTCACTREFLLFDARETSYSATSGIVTNNLQFTGLRDGEYVYYTFDSDKTTNPTRIYVHLKGSAGLAIRLR